LANLLIRADASLRIGTGHIMRCLALAQAWQACAPDSLIVFATTENVPSLESRLIDEGMLIEHISTSPGSFSDASDTKRLSHTYEAGWIVADSYAFDARYQHCLKQEESPRLLLLDDYGHASHYCGNLVLNQNISASADWYLSKEQYTELLLGPRYALLRREFVTSESWRGQEHAVARRILVTMGGADAVGATGSVLEALKLIKSQELEIRVLVGAANPHRWELSQRIRELHLPAELVSSPASMPEIMAWSDIAVSAAGGTLWELLFMQVPTIAIGIAENQLAAARSLHDMGATISFELDALSASDLARSIQQLILSSETRGRMAMGGRRIVDGYGASRVVSVMLGNQGLSLRETKMRDCRLLWDWANDSDIRSASFQQESIPWETHVKWLNARLSDPNTKLFIAEQNSAPVGQLRYELDGSDAVISFSLDREIRGRGVGNALISLGSKKIFLETEIERIHAYIRPENGRSIRAFLRAGYCPSGTSFVRGTKALHFLLKREAFYA
jgi:UDP-2,4-diacetamido-2,4,6-trideoxy-beta-L-altropyranose hydrolase